MIGEQCGVFMCGDFNARVGFSSMLRSALFHPTDVLYEWSDCNLNSRG